MGKLFGTDGIRGVVGENLTADMAFRVGQAIATVLEEEKGSRPTVVIGKDTRISSDMLESALMAGICSVGGDVKPLGTIPTPAVAYLSQQERADAGIVISASHNPYEHNGIKVFSGQGYKLSDAVEAPHRGEDPLRRPHEGPHPGRDRPPPPRHAPAQAGLYRFRGLHGGVRSGGIEDPGGLRQRRRQRHRAGALRPLQGPHGLHQPRPRRRQHQQPLRLHPPGGPGRRCGPGRVRRGRCLRWRRRPLFAGGREGRHHRRR